MSIAGTGYADVGTRNSSAKSVGIGAQTGIVTEGKEPNARLPCRVADWLAGIVAGV